MSKLHIRPSKSSEAFTLIELLVIISIISLLISILLPSLQSSLDAGRSVRCKSNLRQIVMAANDYWMSNRDLPLGMYSPSNFGPKLFMKDSATSYGTYFNNWSMQYSLAPVALIGKTQTVASQGLFACPGKTVPYINDAWDLSYLVGNVVSTYQFQGTNGIHKINSLAVSSEIRLFYGGIGGNFTSAAQNGNGPIQLNKSPRPGIMPLLFDELIAANPTTAIPAGYTNTPNHQNYMNVAYCDGSARTQQPDPRCTGNATGQAVGAGSTSQIYWYYPYVLGVYP